MSLRDWRANGWLTWDDALVMQLDRFRKKRNIGGYEVAGVVSDREATEMVKLAERLRDDLIGWLRATHPLLLDDRHR